MRKRSQTQSLILCALFAALIAVGAFVRIPVPLVPFTLQLEFVLLAGLLLGAKQGALSVWIYIAMGLLGLPVFTQGGGPAYVLQPSFGYILGFAFGAYAAGAIARRVPRPSYRRLLAASYGGLGIVYLFGMVHFYLIYHLYLHRPIGLWPVFLNCFLLLVPGDLALCAAGALAAKRLIPVVGTEK